MTPRPRSLRRRIFRWVFGFVVAIVGILLVVLGLLQTDWARDKVRGKLEQALRAKINGNVTVGRIDGDLMDAVTVRDIVVTYADGREAIRIERLALDYRLGPLLDNHFHADRLEVDGLTVDARRGPDGRLLLADLWISEPRQDPEVWTITLEEVLLDRSSISVEMRPGVVDHFTGVSLRAGVLVGVDRTAVDLGSLAARWEEKQRNLSASGQMVFGTLDIELNNLIVTFGGSRLEVPFARRFGKGATQASGNVAVNAGDLRSLWPESGLLSDALLAFQLVQTEPEATWRTAINGRVGTASLALVTDARLPVEAKADRAAIPFGATGSIFWSGAQPHTIWSGAPRGDVTGAVVGEWTGNDLATGKAAVNLDLRGTMRGITVDASHLEASLESRVVIAKLDGASSLGRVALEARATLPERLGDEGATRAIVVESASVDAHLTDVGRLEETLEAHGVIARDRVLRPGGDGSGGGRPVHVRGAVSLHATASGPIADLSVRARVTSRSLRRGGMHVTGLDVQAAVADALDAPTGTVAARAAGISIGGTGYGGARVSARITDGGRRASATFTLDGRPDLDASGALRVERNDAAVRIDVDRLRVRTRAVEWTAEGGHLLVANGGRRLAGNVELRSTAGHVRVAAALRRAGGTLNGPIDVKGEVDLGQVAGALGPLPLPRLQGKVAATARVVLPAGPAHVEAKGTAITWKGGPKKLEVDLTGDIASRRLTLHADAKVDGIGEARADLVARAPARLTDVAGWKRLTGGATHRRNGASIESLVVVADEVKLAALGRILGQKRIAGGTANVKLTAGAGLRTGRLELDVAKLELAAAPKTDRMVFDGHADVELATDRVVVGLRADAGKRGSLTADAVLDRPARPLDAASWRRAGISALRSAKVRGKAIQLAQFETLLRPVDDDEARKAPRLDLGGTVDVALDTTARAERIDLVVKLNEVRARALATPLSGALRLRAGAKSSRLDVDLRLDKQPLVKGDVKLAAGTEVLLAGGDLGARLRAAAINGDIALPDQPVQRLVRIVDPDAKVGGRVSGAVRLRGSLDALTTTLHLSAPGVTAEGVRFETVEVKAKSGPGGWNASAIAEQADGGRLRLTAEGGAADHEPLSLRLRASSIKLGFLAPLWRRPGGGLTHLDGLLHADVTVKGSMSRPVIDGYVRVRDGEARLPDFLRPLTKARVDVNFARSVATIAMRADSRPGGVRLDATADLREPARATFDARIKGRKLPVLAANQLLSVNGKVRVKGRLEDRLWKVDATIDRGLLVRLPSGRAAKLHDTAPLDDVIYVDPAGIAAREGLKAAARSTAMGFRLRVKTDDKIIVRGDMIATDAAVDITVTVIAGVTSVTGEIEARRGWVEIIGRRYDIRRARVIFAGEIPPDPRLDVRVSHKFTTTNVYIDVVGRASNPRVSFSSDGGSQDQAQLLALILSGDSPGEDTDVQQKSASAAANLLAGQVASSIRQSGLPIDALRVGTEAGAEQPITYVTVGKWLTPRLFVAYRRRFESDVNENANEGVFQHFFAQDWMWEATAGDRGAASADLLWVVPF